MAIYSPGKKFRSHRLLSKKKGKRDVTAVLSLTAMVDMFTVLVVFLLQNYNVTGEVIFIPKEVVLPKASQIKELKPSHVVTISNKEILVDGERVVTFDEVVAQKDWMVQALFDRLKADIEKSKEEAESDIKNTIQSAVDNEKPEEDWNKVTIQADKGMDFLTVKKVMYTVTEAGAGEINFAVLKQADNQP